jgi:hypothetical protein
VRGAPFVVRLAYTRSEAAEALGISRSTLIRRVLPYVETVELASGSRLIPVDELERFVGLRRREVVREQPAAKRPGRPALVPFEVVERIRDVRAAGQSWAEIARVLTGEGVPTAHGGKRWWPSTVRAVAARTER